MNSATAFNSSGGFAGTATQVAARPETHVESELNRMAGSIASLFDLISGLEDRLCSVLRSPEPIGKLGGSGPGEPPRVLLVPHATTLREMRERLENEGLSRLRGIIERLEA